MDLSRAQSDVLVWQATRQRIHKLDTIGGFSKPDDLDRSTFAFSPLNEAETQQVFDYIETVFAARVSALSEQG